MKETEFPIPTAKKILKTTGMNVSSAAATKFANFMTDICNDIVCATVAHALQNGRRYLKEEDVAHTRKALSL